MRDQAGGTNIRVMPNPIKQCATREQPQREAENATGWHKYSYCGKSFVMKTYVSQDEVVQSTVTALYLKKFRRRTLPEVFLLEEFILNVYQIAKVVRAKLVAAISCLLTNAE